MVPDPSVISAASSGIPPLASFRVIDCSTALGAFATRLLTELGAEVVKIEPPAGDEHRRRGPFRHAPDANTGVEFLHYHAGQRSVTLDLDHHDGMVLFRRLLERADVLIESFPVGYLAAHGAGPDRLTSLNPRLIHASITPFGLSGPRANWQASDLTLLAVSGLMQMCGDPERDPLRVGGLQSTQITGLYAALTVVIALLARERDGVGQFIEIAAQEAIAPLFEESGRLQAHMLTGVVPKRQGNGRDLAFPYGTFAALDGAVAITATTSRQWEALADWIHEATGDEVVVDELFHGTHFDRGPYTEVLTPIVEAFASSLDRATLFREGQRRGIPILPVNEIGDLLQDPHLAERGMFAEFDHPRAGRYRDTTSAMRVSDAPTGPHGPAPLLGADTQVILGDELGLSGDDLAALRHAGVI